MATKRTETGDKDVQHSVEHLNALLGDAALDGRHEDVRRIEDQINALESKMRIEVAKAAAQLKRQAAKAQADQRTRRREAHAALVKIETARRLLFEEALVAADAVAAKIEQFLKLSREGSVRASELGMSGAPWQRQYVLIGALLRRLKKSGLDIRSHTIPPDVEKRMFNQVKNEVDLLPTIPELSQEDR